jgi:hypothetical protein
LLATTLYQSEPARSTLIRLGPNEWFEVKNTNINTIKNISRLNSDDVHCLRVSPRELIGCLCELKHGCISVLHCVFVGHYYFTVTPLYELSP